MRFTRGLMGLLMALSAAPGLAVGKEQSLLPLKRMTVGPNDNFQATVDEAETYLYYTRSENLSSQIMRLNLKTGLTEAITDSKADAKTPALSPDGKNLAMNYFKDDAKGDICIYRGKDAPQCISKKGVVDQSPVWIGNDKLAYISSDDSGYHSELKIYDLGSKKTEVLFAGELYSPDLSPDGKTLVYKGKKNELVLYDIKSRKVVKSILVDLPGLTGPSRFSSDGRYLYIAQYMLDSNRDLVIDGRDAAAIYRYDVTAGAKVEPIQITSLDQNCSFPYPTRKYLYMTCAFEGALDIYRGPLTGTVPADWTAEDLTEGHEVARSYSDRILFLNHLYARLFKIPLDDYQQRVMQNFILAGEYQPALYYLDEVLATHPDRQDLRAWKVLFQATLRWEVLPQKRNLGAFAEFIQQKKKELNALPKSPETKLVNAYLDFYANQFDLAKGELESLQFKDDMALFLQSRLAKWSLKDRYPQFLENKVLAVDGTQENRLYFLALWLGELPVGKDPAPAIARLKPRLKAPATDLLDNEADLFKLTQATDAKSRIAALKPIVARIERLKANYFAGRLLFNRSVVLLYRNKSSKDMADIVSIWISYVKHDSKEFPFAIEAMRQNSLDLAYQFYHSKTDQKLALGAFYDSIRISDDLEAHFQRSVMKFAQWPDVVNDYNKMVANGVIKPESRDFVESLKRVLNAAKPLDAKDYLKEAEIVAKIDDLHVGAGVKFLYLGYLYHRALEFSYKGFKYDAELAEKTHKAYLFAIDAGLKNDRIQASALQDLGVLHLQLRNYTLASEFLTQRHSIPYASDDEELAVLWLKARAMFLSYRSPDAYEAMKTALALHPKPVAPFQEKAAFYAWNANQFEDAEKLFQGLPASNLTPPVRLGYAHTLLGLNKSAEAQKQLNAVLAAIPAKSSIDDAPAPALKVQNLHLRFIALGMLAQTQGLAADARIKALRERLEIFPTITDHAKTLHLQAESLSDQKVKESEDLATLLAAAGQKAQANQAMDKALDEAARHGKDYGYLNSTLLQALKNAWMQSGQIAVSKAKSQELVAKIDKEFNDQKEFTSLVTEKWAQLKLVQAGFLDHNLADAKARIFASKAVQAMQKDKPEVYTNLSQYSDALSKDARG